MKEVPLIFNDAMVRAILDGRKTQTRRIAHDISGIFQVKQRPCEPGDVIWVRECWTPDHAAFYPHYPIIYRADGYDPRENSPPGPSGTCWSSEQRARFPFKWRPSIHMPRWACRLFLDVTLVRCERLQEITEADAMEEGVERIEYGPHTVCGEPVHPMTSTYREAFAKLWDSIYAAPQPIKQRGTIVGYRSFPWAGVQETRTHKGLPWYVVPRPWVFAITFERR